MNKTILDYIKELSKSDTKSLAEKGLKTAEECGELAKCILPYDSAFATNHRFVKREDILEESVDTILCALSCAYHLGFSDEQIENMMWEKSAKWKKQQDNEKDITYPLPFEIHVTVHEGSDFNFYKMPMGDVTNDPDLYFKKVCEDNDIKPLIFDMNAGAIRHKMGSKKHFGTNSSAYEASQQIRSTFVAYGYKIDRVKIETVPWHPMAPRSITDKAPEGCYFEAHIPITVNYDDSTKLERVITAIKNDLMMTLYSSQNILKPTTEGKITIIYTYRIKYTLNKFEHDIKQLSEVLTEINDFPIEVARVHKEFSVYDTNESHDAEWLKAA